MYKFKENQQGGELLAKTICSTQQGCLFLYSVIFLSRRHESVYQSAGKKK